MIKSMKKIPVAMCVATLAWAANLQAVELPKIVRIIVPASPGAGTDLLARALAVELGNKTGKTFIVENKPGASTMLGSAYVAKGPKDGSVLLINSTSLISSAASMKTPLLDVQKDLQPVAMLVKSPLVVAASIQSDIKTPADLVKAAKSNNATHGSTGVGSIAHYAQEFLGDAVGGRFDHVPYKGGAAAVSDLSGGIIDTVIGAWTTVAPAVQAGRARAVAVTSLEKNPAFPELSTVASVVPGFNMDLWLGIFAPSGISPEMVALLNKEIRSVSSNTKLLEFYAADGGEKMDMEPAKMQDFIKSEYKKFKEFSAEKNIYIN